MPISGIVIWKSESKLEQVALELLVGAVELVDEQHRRARAPVAERLQQGPLDQEVGPEELPDARRAVAACFAAGRRTAACFAAERRTAIGPFLFVAAGCALRFAASGPRRLREPDLDELPRVVPLVDRVRDVEALVALEADELGVEGGREHLGDLGLAYPGLALQQQRAAQLQREVDGGRQTVVGDVHVLRQELSEAIDGCGHGGAHGRRDHASVRSMSFRTASPGIRELTPGPLLVA